MSLFGMRRKSSLLHKIIVLTLPMFLVAFIATSAKAGPQWTDLDNDQYNNNYDSGAVIIGTNTPVASSEKLHVAGDTILDGDVDITHPSLDPVLSISEDSENYLEESYITSDNQGVIQTYEATNPASELLLQPGGGNVGIGVTVGTSLTDRLTVNGNTTITSDLTVSGNAFITGDLTVTGTVDCDDADTLDTMDSTDFATASHSQAFTTITGEATDAQIPNTITVDNATNATNADTLDTMDSTDFATASHSQAFTTITGEATDAQIPNTITINEAANAATVDTVDNTINTNDVPRWDGSKLTEGSIYDDYSSGYVGIGTTTPSSTLEVNGPITAYQFLAPGSNYMQYYAASESGGFRFRTGTPASSTDVFQIFDDGDANFPSGNVGIGTTSPAMPLHILLPTPPTSSAMQLEVGSDNQVGFRLKKTGLEYILGLGLSGTTEDFFIWDNTASVARFVINSSGDVAIGHASPSYKLHVAGTAAGTSWTNLSSREYKENIEKVDASKQKGMLSQLMKLELTTYEYKQEVGGDGTTKIGFIAEEMPKEVLSKDGKGVDVYELLTYTIGAMQEQQKIISELSAKIKELENN